MFELLPRLKPLHLLLLPQSPDPEISLGVWKDELFWVKKFLETQMDTRITDEALAQKIRLYNRLRRTVEKVYQMNTGPIPLVYGSEINRITSMAGFECDLEARIQDMAAAMEKIRERVGQDFLNEMKHRPRILLTGCPTTNKKLLHLIEEQGGVVVAMETCNGLKPVGKRVKEGQDPMDSLARKYLDIACACMSPNTRRLDLIGDLIEQYRVDGVIDLTWNACHTYNVESFTLQEAVQDRFDTPYIQILTDYSQNDLGQLATRVQAFLEMIV
ncbi:MAG: 2-hydroxyacyl-CoA dehydratase [Desulfobacter sp.]|nr:2-hydroxyacyl-CoA dehydratase [Desulfobacter sp.]